jgi:hypothetical protein
MDVNCISNGANTKRYSSICIDFQCFVRPTKGLLIFVLGTLAQHDLVVDVIGMQDLRFVFVFIVNLNQMLLACSDVFFQFAVCWILNTISCPKLIVMGTFATRYGK